MCGGEADTKPVISGVRPIPCTFLAGVLLLCRQNEVGRRGGRGGGVTAPGQNAVSNRQKTEKGEKEKEGTNFSVLC